jgi:hypothetical protein
VGFDGGEVRRRGRGVGPQKWVVIWKERKEYAEEEGDSYTEKVLVVMKTD